MRIRLTPGDRERLGAPEWLELDTDRFSVMEAEALSEAGLSATEAAVLLRGWPAERDGEPVLDAVGREVRQTDPRGWHARVWVALRRAGITVPYPECDFDVLALEVEYDPPPVTEPGDGEGKAPPADEPSEISGGITTP